MSLARVARPSSRQQVVGEPGQVAALRLAAVVTGILMLVSGMGGHEQQARHVEETRLHPVAERELGQEAHRLDRASRVDAQLRLLSFPRRRPRERDASEGR